MSFDVSPEYLSAIKAECQQIEEEDAHEKMPKAQTQNDAQFVRQSVDIGAGEDSAVRKQLPKKANAPRSVASIENIMQKLQLDEELASDVGNTGTDTTLSQKIPVKQDTLSVMAKMFSARSDSTKGVRWTQFARALIDAGLTATRSSVGPAVSFSNNEHGAVTIHMPHPEPELNAVMLRGHGRRLSKWFGWTNDTFGLRQKGAVQVQENATE